MNKQVDRILGNEDCCWGWKKKDLNLMRLLIMMIYWIGTGTSISTQYQYILIYVFPSLVHCKQAKNNEQPSCNTNYSTQIASKNISCWKDEGLLKEIAASCLGPRYVQDTPGMSYPIRKQENYWKLVAFAKRQFEYIHTPLPKLKRIWESIANNNCKGRKYT